MYIVYEYKYIYKVMHQTLNRSWYDKQTLPRGYLNYLLAAVSFINLFKVVKVTLRQ